MRRRDHAAPRSAALLRLDLTEELPDVDVPTLVIVGTADVLTPPATRDGSPTLMPGARLGSIAGAGHMLMLERTDDVDALIIDFARECRDARSVTRSRTPPRRWADVLTDVPGVRVGHWTGADTGVTVVVLPAGTVGSVEIRGGAPATRETALLDPRPRSSRSTRSCSRAARRSAWPRPTA